MFNWFSKLGNSEPKKEAQEEELKKLKAAIMSEEDYYTTFQILMIGDFITRLLALIVDDPESKSLKDSAGVDCMIKTVNVKNDDNIEKTFKLQFLDVSKQEQFKFLRSKFKPYAILIVYDVTAIASFSKAETWLRENDKYTNGSVCMLLVGIKWNLDNDNNKVVKTETAREFIESSKIHKPGAVQMEE